MVKISVTRRTRWTPRALFIFNERLFAIFKMSAFCGGLKPPLYVLCLQQRLKTNGVASREWSVRISARVSAHGALMSYILLFLLYLQRSAFGVVAGSDLVISGTWVRFPGPPIISILFFLMLSCAVSKMLNTMHLTHPTSQVSLEVDPKVQKARTPYSGLSACVGDPRKSNDLKLNGP